MKKYELILSILFSIFILGFAIAVYYSENPSEVTQSVKQFETNHFKAMARTNEIKIDEIKRISSCWSSNGQSFILWLQESDQEKYTRLLNEGFMLVGDIQITKIYGGQEAKLEKTINSVLFYRNPTITYYESGNIYSRDIAIEIVTDEFKVTKKGLFGSEGTYITFNIEPQNTACYVFEGK